MNKIINITVLQKRFKKKKSFMILRRNLRLKMMKYIYFRAWINFDEYYIIFTQILIQSLSPSCEFVFK